MPYPESMFVEPDHPILDVMQKRWSPYRMLPKEVEEAKLRQIFEAGRWAASSYNDQPWSFIVARRQDEEEFAAALGCLVEANQAWAKNAGVLVLTATRKNFRKNDKPNRVAQHDLGAAAAHMALQAATLGLALHQMAGINPSIVRSTYGVPEPYEPQTGIAIGYPDLTEPSPEDELGRRDASPRSRLPLEKTVFAGRWEQPAKWV